MANNGTAIVGAVAGIALIFTFFVYFDSNMQNGLEEVIVTNEQHTHSLDDVTDGAPNFCIEKWDLEKETIELTFSRIEG